MIAVTALEKVVVFIVIVAENQFGFRNHSSVENHN